MADYTDDIRQFSEAIRITSQESFGEDLASLESSDGTAAVLQERIVEIGTLIMNAARMMGEFETLLEGAVDHSGKLARSMDHHAIETSTHHTQAEALASQSTSGRVREAATALAGALDKARESAGLGHAMHDRTKEVRQIAATQHNNLDTIVYALAEASKRLEMIVSANAEATENSGEASMLGLDAANKLGNYVDGL